MERKRDKGEKVGGARIIENLERGGERQEEEYKWKLQYSKNACTLQRVFL